MPKTVVKLDRKQGLYLKNTLTKGRGVFCTTDIRKGERLEETPAIVLNEKMTDATQKTVLADYVFMLGKVSKKLLAKVGVKNSGDATCVVMGIASYCNHDEDPNAEVVWEERNEALYYILQATRKIPKDTEICTSYGDRRFEKD